MVENAWEVCGDCNGTGKEYWGGEPIGQCKDCGGTGRKKAIEQKRYMDEYVKCSLQSCISCGGSGYCIKLSQEDCTGDGSCPHYFCGKCKDKKDWIPSMCEGCGLSTNAIRKSIEESG